MTLTLASAVKFSRVWAMPNAATFTIPPIKALIDRYVGDGKGWADPFAGNNSPAEFTNDLNPETKAKDHEKALDWVKKLPSLKGAIDDPPYSLRQVKEVYDSVGATVTFEESKMFYKSVKDALAPKVVSGGLAICCGWNTGGFGMNRGFEMVEILLVPHGGNHNDTIVTVERKAQGGLYE